MKNTNIIQFSDWNKRKKIEAETETHDQKNFLSQLSNSDLLNQSVDIMKLFQYFENGKLSFIEKENIIVHTHQLLSEFANRLMKDDSYHLSKTVQCFDNRAVPLRAND